MPAIAFTVFFVENPAFSRPQLNPAPYPGFGMFVALLGGALMLIGIAGTLRRGRQMRTRGAAGRRCRSVAHVPPDLGGSVHRRRQTPNIGRLLLIAFLVLFVSSSMNQLMLHLATYLWQLDGHQTQRLLMAQVFGVLALFLIVPAFIRRVSSRRAMMLGLVGFFALNAAAVLLPLLGLSPLPATAAMSWFVMAFRFASGIAYGLYVVPFNTITYDIGDEHEANTGRPQQGLVGSSLPRHPDRRWRGAGLPPGCS